MHTKGAGGSARRARSWGGGDVFTGAVCTQFGLRVGPGREACFFILLHHPLTRGRDPPEAEACPPQETTVLGWADVFLGRSRPPAPRADSTSLVPKSGRTQTILQPINEHTTAPVDPLPLRPLKTHAPPLLAARLPRVEQAAVLVLVPADVLLVSGKEEWQGCRPADGRSEVGGLTVYAVCNV